MAQDIIIIGGGLAGLVNAIRLTDAGLRVLVIEKKQYPFHKVCGEYISNEVLPFLKSIGADYHLLSEVRIDRFRLSAPSGRWVETSLPLGGFGISRYTLDAHLYTLAADRGVAFLQKTSVQKVIFEKDEFTVWISGRKKLTARVVIGAFGKRSNLDRILSRPFFFRRSPYLGVKYHMKWDTPRDQVILHTFRGGYCGVSMVEEGRTNICYLSRRADLKKMGGISQLESGVLGKNPHLKEVFSKGVRLFDEPLVINEISFAPKSAVENHILMAGDSAGLIAPLCGNGMAMAIRSAAMLSELIAGFLNGDCNRKDLEIMYERKWQREFGRRLWLGRQIQALFANPVWAELSVRGLRQAPGLLTKNN